MKKKIVYWSPCLNPVGTLKSTINSAKSLTKHGKKNYYSVFLINVCGEWDKYKNELEDAKINIVNLSFSYYNLLPKEGFFKSRFSYIVIILISFFPLIRFLFKEKPDFLIAHLITSLPILIFNFFNFKTKLILRISGFPKLHFLRKLFWKKSSINIFHTTCPSIELMDKLKDKRIFNNLKISFLPDAIIDYTDFKNDLKKNIEFEIFNKDKKIILAGGRLTKQKNFSYLINEFSQFSKINNDYILVVLGEGEEKMKLDKMVIKNKMEDKIFLPGRTEGIYRYMKKSDIFVLSSLWEEVGFVIVEAALSNLFIVSSNCPNGPSEFLNHGTGGILFDNNKDGALAEALVKYCELKHKKNYRYESKKSTLKYTKYRHFLKLKNILENKTYIY